MPAPLKRRWIWWNLPEPPPLQSTIADFIDPDAKWDGNVERLVALMAPAHLAKVRAAQANGPAIGAVYRRIRTDDQGRKVQRAEVRFDGIGGCLRTPAGGSSRQILLSVNSGRVQTRLLTPREAARLMGVPDSYVLPSNYNEAYHLMGDGVVVPVVSWLERHLLRPMVNRVSRSGLLS